MGRLVTRNGNKVTITDTLTQYEGSSTDSETLTYKYYKYNISLSQKGIYDAITVLDSDVVSYKSEYTFEKDKLTSGDWYNYTTIGGIDVFHMEIEKTKSA